MEVKSFIENMIQVAIGRGVSDIYIFPSKNHYTISFRYHTQKNVHRLLSIEEGEKVLLHLKYRAEMDIGEKRKAQSGSIDFDDDSHGIQLRLSTVSNFQQKETMVIRILCQVAGDERLRFCFKHQIKELYKKTSKRGLYLFSGPVGSGKTTTMYQIASQWEKDSKQIITIEDPVELYRDNFLQLQVNEKIELTYEKLIKQCLRHRPDLLIVGEIRDKDTARMVLRGSLTGHTIFSTIHTQNTYGVIARLSELGISYLDIKQCLGGISYQRLLPRYCDLCEGVCSPYCNHINTNGKHAVLFDWLDCNSIQYYLDCKKKSNL